MRYSFLLVVLLTAAFPAFAQKKQVSYTTALSFSPLSLADVDNMLLLGVEHRFGDRWSFVGDAGFIFSSYYLNEQKSSRGFNLRPSIRRYLDHRQRTYVQAQGFYKLVHYRMNDWLGKECVNDVPTYDQLQEFTYRKQVWGLHLLTGINLPLTNRLLFDVYFGVGLRQRTSEIKDEPNSCYDLNGSVLNIYRDITTPSLPAGIKLVYSLR